MVTHACTQKNYHTTSLYILPLPILCYSHVTQTGTLLTPVFIIFLTPLATPPHLQTKPLFVDIVGPKDVD